MKIIKLYAFIMMLGISLIWAMSGEAYCCSGESFYCRCMQSAFFKDLKFGDPWTVRMGGSLNVGEFIGLKHSYAELDFFVSPKACSRAQHFIDFRGYLLDNGKGGASVGIGRRLWDPGLCRVLGFNLYYDYFRGKFGTFNRIGFGLEYLGDCFDIRANVYFPLNHASRQKKLHVFNAFIGPFVETCQEREFSFFGIDAEIGTPIGCDCFFDFYAAAGPYFYHRSKIKPIYGGYARLNLNMGEWLQLEARISSDNLFGTNYQGALIINVPIYTIFPLTCEPNIWRELMTQPVHRNGLIFTKTCCDRSFNWEELLEEIEDRNEEF